MRNNKNNIILSVRNITLNYKILISYFKNITFSLIILILSLVNIISISTYVYDVSALDYKSNIGVGFTFNPTLSISLSSGDLVIDNLTPGSSSDSNSINVSVATNASYGYTLSATTDNEDLIHTNNANTFTSIPISANLPSLDTDNTWGYSYKNNLASTPTWSSYSGLSTNINKVLFNADNNTSSSIDFKIAAKASSTQPGGIYTGTINFIAISKPIPRTIEDIAYMQTFGELNPTDLQSVKNSMILNQDYILKDSRDEKEYYVTRLEDGNVWMTQNLDLDISANAVFSSKNTDLNEYNTPGYIDGYSNINNIVYWEPANTAATIDFKGTEVSGWQGSNISPYSANKTDDTGIGHASLGNYYNWTAAIASSNSEQINTRSDAANSICPAGWKLPKVSNNEIGMLLVENDIIANFTGSKIQYEYNGFEKAQDKPLYFTVIGYITKGGQLGKDFRKTGYYWVSSAFNDIYAYYPYFNDEGVWLYVFGTRVDGKPIRCLAR